MAKTAIPSRRAALFTVWMAVISYCYGSVVFREFRSPIAFGKDIEFLLLWFLLAVAMIVIAAAFKRAVAIVFSIVAVACLMVLILSRTFFAAVVACGFFVLAHIVGCRLLRMFGVASDDIALTIPLGLIVPALCGFILAALHLLTTFSIALLLLSLAIAALYSRGSTVTPLLLSVHSTEGRLPLLLTAPAVLLNLTWAVAPEIQFDANNYHLAVSQIFLRNHGFIHLPYFFHSYFYRLVEMLFTIALALNGSAAAKLLAFGFGLLAAFAVFSLGKLVFDENVGLWAAAFFYTTPIVSWLSGTAYIDNAVAMFLTAAVIAFLRWHRSREETGWLYAAASLAGATVAAKVNAAFGLPIILAVALWHLRSRPKTLAVCALLTILIAAPWYALTYHWTGNPVLPMLNGIFKSPLWEAENRVMDAKSYGIGVSPRALSRLPFSLTWNTIKFGTATPRGAAGTAILFALPFSFALIAAKKKNMAILAAIAVLYFILWAVSFQNIRYYVHILPVICVVGVATVFHLSDSGWSAAINRICFALLLIVQFPLTSMQFWDFPDRFPIAVALRMETRDDFLRRSLRSYAGAQHLNAIAHFTERVLAVGTEDVRFYLNAPLETLEESTNGSVLRNASSMHGEALRRILQQSGFAYIFVKREALKDPPAWHPYIQQEFLKRFTTVAFSDANTVVYRLSD